MAYDLEYWKKWRSTTSANSKTLTSFDRLGGQLPTKQFDERYRKTFMSTTPRSSASQDTTKTAGFTFPKQKRLSVPARPARSIHDRRLLNEQLELERGTAAPLTAAGGAIGLESRKRRNSQDSGGPGPGEYPTTNLVGQKQVTSDKRSPAAHLFSASSRSLPAPSNTGPGPIYSTPSSLSSKGGRFSQEQRLKESTPMQDSPGPGAYRPNAPSRSLSCSFGTGFLKRNAADELFNVFTSSGFGYGCDIQQHIKFGRCLDGQCSNRAAWEKKAPTSQPLKYFGNAKPPVHLLILNGDPPFTEVANRLLTDEELELNEADDNGRTVLHNLCVTESSLDCNARLLFVFQFCRQAKRSIDIDHRDVDGNTALLLAVKNGLELAVETLLLMGANPSLENNDGVSPLSLSMDQQNHTIYQHVRASVMLRDLRSRLAHGLKQTSSLQQKRKG